MDIAIVACGPGIGMLKLDSPTASRVADTMKANLRVVACENTMRAQKITKDDMLPAKQLCAGRCDRNYEKTGRRLSLFTALNFFLLPTTARVVLQSGHAGVVQWQNFCFPSK